jgi:hypothetical protein
MGEPGPRQLEIPLARVGTAPATGQRCRIHQGQIPWFSGVIILCTLVHGALFLQIGHFHPKFWSAPMYLDQTKAFYKALGGNPVYSSLSSIVNPWSQVHTPLCDDNVMPGVLADQSSNPQIHGAAQCTLRSVVHFISCNTLHTCLVCTLGLGPMPCANACAGHVHYHFHIFVTLHPIHIDMRIVIALTMQFPTPSPPTCHKLPACRCGRTTAGQQQSRSWVATSVATVS